MAATVTLKPSDRRFEVDPGETILAAALRAGILLPYGCKSGACGTCRAHVIDGRWTQGRHAASALSAEQQAAGDVLVCCAEAQSDLQLAARELVGLADLPVRRMPCRVNRIERVAPDVAIVTLQLPAGEPLQYRAGQYLEFILADGARRSYSIATGPDAAGPVQLHVRHMPGGRFTDALFGAREPAIQERAILRCEAPLGTFFLREDGARPIVLLAGGTGFAPLKAIVERIFQRGLDRDAPGRPARPVVLYWGCRGRRDLYLDALPAAWQAEHDNFRYVPVLSEPAPDDDWHGRTGLVHQAVMADLPDLSGAEVYACGAPAMVSAARRDFAARCALPSEQFHADAFTSQADLAGA